ncbi:MAG: DEAD/DEAH box helicase [Firmicutes bacterium]|nr:DEAD/DEAH box helicase [Bacillota bacterium]MCM1400931.1 DEAD/DEAH box helicase [Bacteroides sp.]MCM1476619.1 DEAD/DEAH box helicase [Bacteroides sp.]
MEIQDIVERAKSIPGIVNLNPMQTDALECKSRNLILIAPTGSGKTLAFGMSALKHVTPDIEQTQVIVIAPSRELVMQIQSVMKILARSMKVVSLYGGHNVADEIASLSPTPQIIIATPGRLLDHLQRGNLKAPTKLNVLVLDEYDKSLQLGFEGEMKKIVARLGSAGHIIMTSATKLPELPRYLNIESAQIIESDDRAGSHLEVISVTSFNRDKLQALAELLQSAQPGVRSIVFVNHRESAERVATYLRKCQIDAGLYHGALDQQQRTIAVDLFANGTTPVLVATDLAARGLDIEGVDSVIHYHLPVDEAAWTHRNGRTARQGASGKAFVILSEADNQPHFIQPDRPYQPKADAPEQFRSNAATLYFSAGKKEKISKADILGFILANSNLSAENIGKIFVHDHFSLAAVPAAEAQKLLSSLSPNKLKGKRVKVSIVKHL